MATKIWSASDAKVQFDALTNAAANGDPQVIKTDDGREVVVVAKSVLDSIEPSLKMALLTGGAGQAGDALDDKIKGSQ